MDDDEEDAIHEDGGIAAGGVEHGEDEDCEEEGAS